MVVAFRTYLEVFIDFFAINYLLARIAFYPEAFRYFYLLGYRGLLFFLKPGHMK